MSSNCGARVIPKLSVLYLPIAWSSLVPHTDDFYRWNQTVQEQFTELKPHHRKSLAEYAFGMILAECCGLTSVVARLALFFSVCGCSLKERLRELYLPADAQKGTARSEFDYTRCFAPLLRWAVQGQPHKRFALALDPTCLTDRFRVLCVSVLYQGTSLPVAWTVQAADETGSWNVIWKKMLCQLKDALGDDWEVLVLTDRGLESAALFRVITELGWHPMMRVKKGGKFQPKGWHGHYAMKEFAPAVGRRYAGNGVAYTGSAALPCTLLASWEDGHEEAWLILTDLPATGTDVAWYAWRMWCEQGYRSIKRGQWGWHKTQMSDPMRVARLWAVLALASRWAVDVGAQAEAAALPALPRKPRVRDLSLLKQGLLRLSLALIRGEPLPMPRPWLEQHSWPPRPWKSDTLDEEMMNKC